MNTQTTAPASIRCWNCGAAGITFIGTDLSGGLLLYTDCAECGETQNAIL